MEFDGQPFLGWQRQPQGATVQGALEHACATILKETIAVHAAGRTDAGVHGLGMVAHIDVTRVITPFALMEAINAGLIDVPVAVIACETVAADFHARFSCLARHYEYRIVNRRAPLTLGAGREWRIKKALDADAMHAAAQMLVGHHDFTTFRSVHCQSADPVKTLNRLDVRRMGDRIVIEASARSFLHHQMRSMVGCLSLVGLGRWSAGDLRDALEAKDRTKLGLNAPPDGLYFVRADYL
ncbi:MAG: truA [Sphingomonadales bacterium]|nr:truA [Sphingomonadales bacterium]